MKAILGCFRTTSTAALEFESALPPPHLRLQSKILRSFTRLLTLPEKHPVRPHLEEAQFELRVVRRCVYIDVITAWYFP
jgi:hypothetical protein